MADKSASKFVKVDMGVCLGDHVSHSLYVLSGRSSFTGCHASGPQSQNPTGNAGTSVGDVRGREIRGQMLRSLVSQSHERL